MGRVKLDKKDIYRALLTDTLPGDVPIIFSNDGLYINCHSYKDTHESTSHPVFESFFEKLLSGESQSSPYKYGIKKDVISVRRLSLIHPRSQLNFSNFYTMHNDAIIYLCSLSKASIRAPCKVSNSFYAKDIDKQSSYKSVDIDTLRNEMSRKHSSSYFSYRGHNRLYKLFDSNEFVSLEKKFSSFWMLDVANCFDSIYTHTVSWAVKNKDYIKSNIKRFNQFCAMFDRLIQRSNNNETNGIPIGAEFSRIFAEVIFQDIDKNIILSLQDSHGMTFGADYVIHRYVDDFTIFTRSDSDSETVASVICDELSKYNLYINDKKVKRYYRPFNTEKSNAIKQIKQKILDFEEKILERGGDGRSRTIKLKRINRRDSIVKYFIGEVKFVCHAAEADYTEVSSYLISSLSNRIIELIAYYGRHESSIESDEKFIYQETIIIISRLMFFYYAVSPQVTSSYKLAKTVIISEKFFKSKFPGYVDRYRTFVMQEVMEISFDSRTKDRSGLVELEGLNILLATSEFGEGCLIPEEMLQPLLTGTNKLTYFTVVSLLYYIKDYSCYANLKSKLEEVIIDKVSNAKLPRDSEAAHLFLDSLSCPYISSDVKGCLLTSYLSRVDGSLTLDNEELQDAIQKLEQVYWFVKWQDLNLIKLLERKELNNAY